MRPYSIAISLFAVIVIAQSVPTTAHAGGNRFSFARLLSGRNAAHQTSNQPRSPLVRSIQRQPNPWERLRSRERHLIRSWRNHQNRWMRNRGRIFRRIVEGRDYESNYVLKKTKKVTAFLDWSDPQHPQFDPKRKTGEQDLLDKIPLDRRAHILVIPNKPREHIATNLGDQITREDLTESKNAIRAAEKLAKELGIKNPKIWINSPDRISVAYLHVHIVGERTTPYPPRLSAP